MTLFLTRYFLNEFSVWVWFTPLVFSPILLFSLGSKPFPFIFMTVMYSCVVVFSKYIEVRKNYATILNIAPLSKKTSMQVDFIFLSWITFCYICFSSTVGTFLFLVIQKEFIFLSIHELCFLIGCCLLFITFNSWSIAKPLAPMNALLILNFIIILLFTSLDITLLANDFGFSIFCIALLLALFTYIITNVKMGRFNFK